MKVDRVVEKAQQRAEVMRRELLDSKIVHKVLDGIDSGKKRVTHLRDKVQKGTEQQREKIRAFRSRVERRLQEKPVIKTIDKVTFTATVLLILLTEAILLTRPHLLEHFYAIIIVPLLLVRYWIYHGKRWHFFMLDFCYYTQLLLLFHIYVYPHSQALAFACFAYANGPLLTAVVAWRNSLVFHDVDKTTSLAIHVLPSLVTFSRRWLMPEHFSPPPGEHASSFSGVWAFAFAIMMYLVWQVAYFCKTEVHDRERFRNERGLQTSLRWLSDPEKKTGWALFLGELLGGPSHPERWPFIIMFWQFVYTVVTITFAVLSWRSEWFHACFLCAVISTAVHNGANFYFERFAKLYMKMFEDAGLDSVSLDRPSSAAATAKADDASATASS